MKNTDGIAVSFIAGIFLPVLVFIAGWGNSDFIWSIVGCVIVCSINVVLGYLFRPTRIWLYPLTFALPLLLIGLLALTGNVPTFFVIGLATFFVGLAASYITRKLTDIYSPRSNPSINTDATR